MTPCSVRVARSSPSALNDSSSAASKRPGRGTCTARPLIARYPLLAVHLFDEERQLRDHVNLFHNDTNVKWLDDWGVAVRPGDTLTILQAVSGG